MKPRCLPLLIVLATLAVPGHASATPIAPGTTVVPGAGLPVIGPLLASITTPYALGSGAAGIVEEAVYADATNPFGVNDLTFVLQVQAVSGDGDVDTVGLSSVGALPLDVVQDPSAFGIFVPPTLTASGVADRLTSGVINFTINPPVGMPDVLGTNSWLFLVRTPATHFIAGNITVGGDNVDNTPGSDTVPGFAPVVPVPEPATLTLLGTGLLAVARRRLRARRG